MICDYFSKCELVKEQIIAESEYIGRFCATVDYPSCGHRRVLVERDEARAARDQFKQTWQNILNGIGAFKDALERQNQTVTKALTAHHKRG